MISKIPQYILYVLMIVSVIVTILAFSDNYDAIIYTMYAFFILSVLLTLVLAAVGMIANPKGVKSTVFGLGGAVILFGVSYFLSGNEVVSSYAVGTTEADSKLIGMGLIAMYILFFGSIGAIIYSAASKMFK